MGVTVHQGLTLVFYSARLFPDYYAELPQVLTLVFYSARLSPEYTLPTFNLPHNQDCCCAIPAAARQVPKQVVVSSVSGFY